ncbi:HTH-type transcriptional activator IlvY [Aestuariibacter salexigens]|uniref:HTH-type transcriptional activator IlvY n=1 Tax=Aestuariibacter salexigens TaxID=226010 RepID=UPI000422EA5F|nr:HTH-type transcriptional activator IlvY [Aestuariibacter salexigens]
MDLRTLKLFQHLATSLHFSHTANALYVSPSTLSRTIQRLEEECGAVLLERDNRSVRLTAAGQKMLVFAEQTLLAWQQLKSELANDLQVLTGELSLYCSVTASQSHLPQLLETFRQHYPAVNFHLLTGDPALSVSKVKQQESDVAIAINTPDFPSELEFVSLDNIPLVLVAPRAWGITKLQHLDWRQHEVVMPESGPSRRIVYHWFAEHGIRPKIYADVGGNEALLSLVALGCGVGIVPQVVLDNSVSANLVTRIGLDDIEPYELGLCYLRKRRDDAVIKALIELVTQR